MPSHLLRLNRSQHFQKERMGGLDLGQGLGACWWNKTNTLGSGDYPHLTNQNLGGLALEPRWIPQDLNLI